MPNPFALPIDWQALATFFAGMLAVGSAVAVASRQNRLRMAETRVALLERRLEVLGRFRSLAGEWWRNATLPQDKEFELQQLVRDIQILFDDDVHKAAEALFKDTIFQNMFDRHSNLYAGSGDLQKRLDAVEHGHARLEQIADRLPRLESLLIESTRVGHIFK